MSMSLRFAGEALKLLVSIVLAASSALFADELWSFRTVGPTVIGQLALLGGRSPRLRLVRFIPSLASGLERG